MGHPMVRSRKVCFSPSFAAERPSPFGLVLPFKHQHEGSKRGHRLTGRATPASAIAATASFGVAGMRRSVPGSSGIQRQAAPSVLFSIVD
jgi:hypothetical protein